jgi:hypothetical protein
MMYSILSRSVRWGLVCLLAFVLISCQEKAADPVSSLGGSQRPSQLSSVVERPLTDFTLSQGPLFWYDSDNPMYNLVSDYTGKYNSTYGLNLGTTFEGSIREMALDDGTARVTVILHGKNVLTYAYLTASPYSLVFGRTPLQVQGGATPALGECFLRWEFINSAPGAPIPLLGTNGKLNFNASAVGELRAAAELGPDGTRGQAWTNQVGLIDGIQPNKPLDDGYPAEFVKVKRLEARMVGKN